MEASFEESKKFYHLLLSALHQPIVDSVTELEKAWKLQRLKFTNLLKHQPKSSTDRQKVQSASSAPGISFSDASSASPRQGYVILQQQFVDEALILSDLFDLNELEALKLTIAGQRETSAQPDWPRGLCAVYLFYKNRWYQAQSTRLLMRNRQGRYWRFDDPTNGSSEAWSHLRSLVQVMTDQLWKDNFLANVLGLLQTPGDVVQLEFEKLQQPNVKGLGGPRHRRMVADCIQETYSALGDALYYWCCQAPLDQREFLSLIRFGSENTGKIVRLPIVFSILQALDVNILETSDSEEDIARYAPFTNRRDLLFAFNSAIVDAGDGLKWADVGAQSFVQMAWAVSLRLVAQNPLTQSILEDDDWNQDEEDILNNALQLASVDIALSKSDIRGPFQWLRRYIVTSSEFMADELYQRRLHSFFTQLIASFPLKMKEWRSEADEECRQLAEVTLSGVALSTPPYLHFEQFMLLLGEFYGTPSSSKLNLSEAYFRPISQESGAPLRRIPQVQIALFKFLRTSGEMLPSRLYVAYLRMLAGLASNPMSARLCFEMLKSFAAYGSSLSSVSVDNFFAALDHYLRVLKASSTSASASPHILPDEMKGLQAWFDLIATMAEQDDSARLTLFEHPRWSCSTNVLGLVTCAVPLELKGRALRCLTALAQSPELALALSEGLLASGLVTSLSENKLGGVQQELEELESRLETYPITTGLVNFLAALCQHRSFVPDGPAMTPYVNFVLNSVLVHLMNRNYKTPTELWDLTSAVFRFIHNVVTNYDPTVASIVRQSLGCQVMAALTNDGPVFRTVCRLCIAGVQWLDEYRDDLDAGKGVQEATLHCLKLFYVGLSKQDAFSAAVIDSGVPLLTTSLDVLLQMLNPQTGEADYIVNLAMFFTHYCRLPEHCLYAVRIIDLLNVSVVAHTKIVKYFLANQALSSRVLHGFVNCLSLDDVDASFDSAATGKESASESQVRAQTASAVLELIIADIKHSSGFASLSYFLAGFDTRRPSETKLENPGVSGTPRTCLHAALDIVNAALGQDLETLSFGALVEPSYRLLFWLSASPNTAEATLRYLRTEYDFVRRHIAKLKLLDIHRQDDSETNTTDTAYTIREVGGWLLKLCALELASVANSQPSYITTLSKSLLIMDTDDSYGTMDISGGIGLSTPGASGSTRRRRGGERKTQRGRRLFEFLATLKPLALKNADETVVVPRLQHFEGVRLSKVVAACTIKMAKGYYRCDVARLYEVLEQELVALQGSGVVGQLHLVREEIQNVADSLVRYNEVQRSVFVLRHTFAGFSQTAQILFSVCSLDWMEPEECDQAIVETMVEALRSNLTVAAVEVADLLLSLTTILRRRFNSDLSIEEKALDTTSRKRYAGLLDGSLSTGGRKHALSCAGILATALKLLIEAALKTENRRPDARASLYGSLMNFFRLWQKPSESGMVDNSDGAKSFEPTVRERMAEEHWAIANRYVADLVGILAKDAADGPEVTKTIAMCCLVALLEQDAVHGGVGRKAFTSRGYINAIKFPPQFQKWITMIMS